MSIHVKIHPKSHILETEWGNGKRKSIQHIETKCVLQKFNQMII